MRARLIGNTNDAPSTRRTAPPRTYPRSDRASARGLLRSCVPCPCWSSSPPSRLRWRGPTLVGILLIAFRRELADWMKQRPMRLKVGPVEAEWPRVRSSVELDLEQAGVPPTLASGTGGLLHES